MGLRRLAKSRRGVLQTRDYECPVLRDTRTLMVQLVQYEMRAKIELMNQEVVGGKAKHAVPVKAFLREVFRVLRNDRVGVRHDSGRQDVAVVLVGNALDSP